MPAGRDSRQPYAVTCETHAAVVFLVGDRAYKLKKPVDLGFLDFRTRQARERVCRREVELNRQFSPDVYLGVADVYGPDGAVCDHLVVMRRMPHERRLATLVRAGVPVEEHLRRLARLMAAFHAAARRGPHISAEGGRDAILGRWSDSFAQVRAFRGGVLDDAVAGEIEARTREFLAGRVPLFDERIAAGRIVDGHGDLLTDDIFCLDDGPRALDCIEFDDALRYLDQLDDVAFLAMDLERLGAPELGRRWLDWYAEFSADPAPACLRHHYVAYRAFVRAKVACLRHAQGDADAAADVAAYAALTLWHLRAGTVSLVLVGGLPGTGKSTLAGALADRLGAVLLSSDRVRKETAGLAPRASARAGYQQGIYRPQWTEHTYAELLERATRLLERGESVILDASWSNAAHRERAGEVARRTHSELVPVRCAAGADVVAERLRRRTGSVSDADLAVATAMAADADPWPDAVSVRTDLIPDRSVARVEAAVRPWVSTVDGPAGGDPAPAGRSGTQVSRRSR
jgi:aminoglycoside phosphotransferase family enzyme/predicted kinase